MSQEQSIEDRIDTLRSEVEESEGELLEDAPTPPRRLPSWRRWKRFGAVALPLAAVIIVAALLLYRALPAPPAGEMAVVGRVIRLDGSPLPAQVAIHGTSLQVTANDDGYFRLDHVPSGPQTIVVRHQGYEIGFPVSLEPGTERDVGDLPFWPLGE